MGDTNPNLGTETGEVKTKRTRSSDGKKPLTFIYSDKDGKSVMGIHRTKAFSKAMAWKEYTEKHKLGEECVLNHTFPGQMEEITKEKFRKPTRSELLQLAGITDD